MIFLSDDIQNLFRASTKGLEFDLNTGYFGECVCVGSPKTCRSRKFLCRDIFYGGDFQLSICSQLLRDVLHSIYLDYKHNRSYTLSEYDTNINIKVFSDFVGFLAEKWYGEKYNFYSFSLTPHRWSRCVIRQATGRSSYEVVNRHSFKEEICTRPYVLFEINFTDYIQHVVKYDRLTWLTEQTFREELRKINDVLLSLKKHKSAHLKVNALINKIRHSENSTDLLTEIYIEFLKLITKG